LPVHVETGTQVDQATPAAVKEEPQQQQQQQQPPQPEEQPVPPATKQHKPGRTESKREPVDPSRPRAWASVVKVTSNGTLPAALATESVIVNPGLCVLASLFCLQIADIHGCFFFRARGGKGGEQHSRGCRRGRRQAQGQPSRDRQLSVREQLGRWLRHGGDQGLVLPLWHGTFLLRPLFSIIFFVGEECPIHSVPRLLLC